MEGVCGDGKLGAPTLHRRKPRPKGIRLSKATAISKFPESRLPSEHPADRNLNSNSKRFFDVSASSQCVHTRRDSPKMNHIFSRGSVWNQFRVVKEPDPRDEHEDCINKVAFGYEKPHLKGGGDRKMLELPMRRAEDRLFKWLFKLRVAEYAQI